MVGEESFNSRPDVGGLCHLIIHSDGRDKKEGVRWYPVKPLGPHQFYYCYFTHIHRQYLYTTSLTGSSFLNSRSTFFESVDWRGSTLQKS